MKIKVCQIWKEIETKRYIKILEKEVHGTGPAWTYCDCKGNPEPHGYEEANGAVYNDWYWHYCDVLEFAVWKRFKLVKDVV
jgi:hypothetical protein